MTVFRQRTLFICIAIGLSSALVGCDGRDYVTWACSNTNTSPLQKITIVLDRSAMKFDPMQSIGLDEQNKPQAQISYCGSLGHESYFDARCPAEIRSSAVRFTPSTGALMLGKLPYQCAAL